LKISFAKNKIKSKDFSLGCYGLLMGKMDVQSIAERASNLTNYILLLLLINCDMFLNNMGTLFRF